MSKENYIPALGFAFLTRFYDPLVRFSTRENAFKRALLRQAKLQNEQAILDLACGTGTLAIAVKKRVSQARVFGCDIDEKILGMAREKSRRTKTEIHFARSFSDNLPFADDSFDRILSTLFFHHLTLARKRETLREIRRVLKPGGEFHLADFALPRNKAQFVLSKWIRLIDGDETTRDNLRGRLFDLIAENGFVNVERTCYFKTIIGTIRLFKAIKPETRATQFAPENL